MYLVTVKWTVKISSIFVAFLENMNFTRKEAPEAVAVMVDINVTDGSIYSSAYLVKILLQR